MRAADLRARARYALSGRWGMAVLVGFVASVLGGASATSSLKINLEDVIEPIRKISPELAAMLMGILGVISVALFVYGGILLILGGVVHLGYCRYNLNLVDDRDAQIGDLFSCFNRFLDAFVLRLLTGLFVALWSLLFIIPGIVAAFSYSMAPYIMAEDPSCRPMEALRRSKTMMKGYKMDLFILELSFIGWTFLSALTLGIGMLFLAPYECAARASFYRELQNRPRMYVAEFDPYYVKGDE